MTATLRPTTKLRQLLAQPGAIMAPGVVDPLYARLVARHNFDAMYMSGAGTSAAKLGMPDVGLLTLTEMVDNAARITAISDIPLIADADNGYGGPLNVRRTIQLYERAGVAAIHLEDQVLPKRCGHLAGKQLISTTDMVAKIKAATDARIDGDFVLIARTDALALEGLEAALERAERYREAGADVLFVESPGKEHLKAIPERLQAPTLYNMATSGKTPFLTKSEIAALGFKLIIYPNWLMLAAIRAADGVLATLREEESIASIAPQVPSFQEFFDLVGMQDVRELEERYGVPDAARAAY
ncbi:isocitrate lyase/PEP mutase family protein [Microvirga antarctica]|uniref:isocitrate lyase/PEP mutase family protein n=1 Tax=Microvirga antarctica TaxID=2819233 RepID=UPI001B313074|nr:oxaloacetate decarboxylase [Microvirga antarctica]